MCDAAATGDLEKLKRLLQAGEYVNQRVEYSKTSLMVAAENGHTDCVEYLLQNGAQLYLEDYNGMTAFDLASRRGHGSTVKLLQTAAHKAKGE